MPNDVKPKVNFFNNIPLTDKQRSAYIYRFLDKVTPDANLMAKMKAAETLLSLWKTNSTLRLDEVWEIYQTPAKPLSPEEPKPENKIQEKEEEEKEEEEEESKPHQSFSLDIQLNERQLLAVDFAKSGKSFVLSGAAGTGKTTTEREIVKTLLQRGDLGTHWFKDRRTGDKYPLPGIAVVSFTNKAANTSRKAIHRDPELARALPFNITTIHNLLEFMPVFFDRPDGTTGMRFEPTRHESNPLDIRVLIIEEASTVGALDLYQHLYRALRPNTTIILVGDINQLPPIFSPSILNYALTQLPVVELTEIYRQAEDSPIIANAHRILSGKNLQEARPHFTVISGAKQKTIIGGAGSVQRLIASLKKWSTQPDPTSGGELMYDPEQDIVLSPYNKTDCGTIEINNHIAQFLGMRREADVYEIIAGIHKVYLAVGDRIFFLKQEAVVTRITSNMRYVGKKPREHSKNLTRWGVYVNTGAKDSNADQSLEDFELSMQGYENMNVDDIPDEQGKKQAASHLVDIQYIDSGVKDTLESAGEFAPANFSLGYALTVHKAQGSEWRKVFFLIHKNQIAHMTREMLYTAVTRARTHCMIVDFTDQVNKVISQQRIKGNSLEEKIAYFNSETSLKEPVRVLK